MVLRRNVNIIGLDEVGWSADDYYDENYWDLEDLEALEETVIKEEYEEEYDEPQFFTRQVNPVIRQNQLSPTRKPLYDPKTCQSRTRTPEPKKNFGRNRTTEPKPTTAQEIDDMIEDKRVTPKIQS